MEYLAHSAKDGYPAQSYPEHCKNVRQRAERYAYEAAEYYKYEDALVRNVRQSSVWHDLGKLDRMNQTALRVKDNVQPLPINHVDAGSAYLLSKDAPYSAFLVYSHHRGLRNWNIELCRGNSILRDNNHNIRDLTDHELPELIKTHSQLTDPSDVEPDTEPQGDYAVYMRMALSCLTDADHSDTGETHGQSLCDDNTVPLKAKERLDALDTYVHTLGDNSERSLLRREMYDNCRDAVVNGGFASCDSPVGSGKTTAVMAHLLNQAIKRGSRRVFVILPYTNIISQSVKVYRKALVLPGEDPEAVVAELHYRADFENEDTRRLTALWRAPIIVTTAVAFFETLASNKPSALRRLHELPGSAVFIDEAHAALPVNLLPLALRWMNVLEREWGCYWLLASGSLVRFWKITELTELCPEVDEIVGDRLRTRLKQYESRRIVFSHREKPFSRRELVAWVISQLGPRLLIMNTVQSAAVIADDIRNKYGREKVEHLSSALEPEDREKTIEKVKSRLADKTDDDWTLVATSCVEAGVDFSFRTGFREISSLLSLLQTSGRINRGGEYPDAVLWSFMMQDDVMLKSNPGVRHSAEILNGYFKKGITIEPDLSTQAIRDELTLYDEDVKKRKRLAEDEEGLSFESVADKFKVIDSDTVPVLVDSDIALQFEFGGGNSKLLQKKSVSVARYNLAKWNVREIRKGLYQWTLLYDDFLGIMAGVISLAKVSDKAYFV